MIPAHPVLVWLPIAVCVFAAMDLWAALLHGRVWHGRLWFIHRSHHELRKGRFERNDALSFLHAPLAIALILYGCAARAGLAREVAFGVGLGMTAFGAGYTLVHDGLVHRRLPVQWLLSVPYLRAVVRAHRVHHAGVEGGPPYGLFFGPLELARHRFTRLRAVKVARHVTREA
jgi:beta-carotene 3-hydroxylase